MHGGPGYGGLRREIAQLLGKCRGRWDTSSTTPAGLTGGQGIGYDYVLGAGGLYVQSRSAHLVARVLVAPGSVRGLAPVSEKLTLPHGPIPVYLFEVGLRWFQETPSTERFFAVRWDGGSYRLVVPEQAGTASSLTYRPPAGVVAEFHSHGKTRAFFSGTDDRTSKAYESTGSSESWTPSGQN